MSFLGTVEVVINSLPLCYMAQPKHYACGSAISTHNSSAYNIVLANKMLTLLGPASSFSQRVVLRDQRYKDQHWQSFIFSQIFLRRICDITLSHVSWVDPQRDRQMFGHDPLLMGKTGNYLDPGKKNENKIYQSLNHSIFVPKFYVCISTPVSRVIRWAAWSIKLVDFIDFFDH